MNDVSKILIVGQDAGMTQIVSRLGLCPVLIRGSQEALTKCHDLFPALVIINLPGSTVEPRFLDALSRDRFPVLVLTDREAPSGKSSLKNKNVHVLTRPVHDDDLQAAVRTLLENSSSFAWNQQAAKRRHLGERYLAEYAPLFVHSEKIRDIKEILEQVASTDATVLIRGESGVGKDLVARAIHYASPRHRQPFVNVNCATFSMDLLESELFGHEKGAFTGAYQTKPGKFELASKGTFCLDEIGELPVALQAKLLHVLQDHEFSRVGGREMIQADVRVIATTNRNLEVALRSGHLREDLYYRLNVVEIHVPPLRERKEEIPILAYSFLEKFNQRNNAKVEVSVETIRLFTEYPWPGNVRELQNTILRLVVLGNPKQIHQEILTRLQTLSQKQSQSDGPEDPPRHPSSLENSPRLREIARRAVQEAERKAIGEVLERVHWNRAEAAQLLKTSYKTLLSKIKGYGLAPSKRRSRT